MAAGFAACAWPHKASRTKSTQRSPHRTERRHSTSAARETASAGLFLEQRVEEAVMFTRQIVRDTLGLVGHTWQQMAR